MHPASNLKLALIAPHTIPHIHDKNTGKSRTADLRRTRLLIRFFYCTASVVGSLFASYYSAEAILLEFITWNVGN